MKQFEVQPSPSVCVSALGSDVEPPLTHLKLTFRDEDAVFLCDANTGLLEPVRLTFDKRCLPAGLVHHVNRAATQVLRNNNKGVGDSQKLRDVYVAREDHLLGPREWVTAELIKGATVYFLPKGKKEYRDGVPMPDVGSTPYCVYGPLGGCRELDTLLTGVASWSMPVIDGVEAVTSFEAEWECAAQ